MSIKTIHCRLVAPEPVRRHLWHLMAEHNTPLVNELLKQVSRHPDFETWQRRGTIPEKAVKDLCAVLRTNYPGQPGRSYTSAILMVQYTYESWLALQQKRRLRTDGKQRWLNIVKSDAELIELSQAPLAVIQQRAQDILDQQTLQVTGNKSLMDLLFEAYEQTDDLLSQCAIAHLLKNSCKVAQQAEDPERYTHRIQRKQKEVEQLEQQLKARLPKGRDLTGEEFTEMLETASQQIPKTVEQAKDWQTKLLIRPAELPYPLIYGSSTDIRWAKTEQGRISVNFNGLETYLRNADPEIKAWLKTHQGYPFQVYCDQRQLPFFERFTEDWQAYRQDEKNYPAGLLALRAADLIWSKGKGKGKPWQINHLALHCSFDTRLMTAEGTLDVKQEKVQKVLKQLSRDNADPRNYSKLRRLENIPARPSEKSYQGNPEIAVGLSIGLSDPITVAVVNVRTGQTLTYRTPKKLLGEQYRLFNRHRQQQQQNALKRHKNQKRGIAHQPSESELSQQVDRLLAKSIVQLAQQYQASSIVIPSLKGLRERLSAEIQARAEQACPGSVAAQAKYASRFQVTVHRWSYNRLIDSIKTKAQQAGLAIEPGFQPVQGHPKEQARDIAIAAYHSRLSAVK